MMKSMCTASGTKDKKTNHSLRATGVTCMYEGNGNVPKIKIIQQCTDIIMLKLCTHNSVPPEGYIMSPCYVK